LPRKRKTEDTPAPQENLGAPALHLSATLKQAAGEAAEVVPAKETPETNPARWMHERLINQIVEFEKDLDSEHEVGGRFVQGPGSEPLHIENVASWGPDMIIFVGKYSDGRKFEIIQHYSQVNLFLVAMRTTSQEPRRIGFELQHAMKDEGPVWGDPIS
jgi:hypothetical protein